MWLHVYRHQLYLPVVINSIFDNYHAKGSQKDIEWSVFRLTCDI